MGVFFNKQRRIDRPDPLILRAYNKSMRKEKKPETARSYGKKSTFYANKLIEANRF